MWAVFCSCAAFIIIIRFYWRCGCCCCCWRHTYVHLTLIRQRNLFRIFYVLFLCGQIVECCLFHREHTNTDILQHVALIDIFVQQSTYVLMYSNNMSKHFRCVTLCVRVAFRTISSVVVCAGSCAYRYYYKII